MQSIYKVYPNSTYFVYFTGGGSYKTKALEWAKNHKINILNDFKLGLGLGLELRLGSEKGFAHLTNLRREDYYASIKDYDDLIWRYLLEYGSDGDFIWNVSSE